MFRTYIDIPWQGLPLTFPLPDSVSLVKSPKCRAVPQSARGVIIAHNSLTRNWAPWFGSAPPAVFSGGSFAAEAFLFLFVPLTLAYCVLTGRGHTGASPADGFPLARE